MNMAVKDGDSTATINVQALQFAYDSHQPLFADFNLDVSSGSRCLLVGANGSGKTSLLKILAGKHMVGGRDVVRVLNCSAFHDTQLVCSGELSYLGGSWTKTVGSAGEVPLQGDISAERMIFGVEGADRDRRDSLIELLDIDLQWRMHKVSDGQRRRVQICMGLLHPFKKIGMSYSVRSIVSISRSGGLIGHNFPVSRDRDMVLLLDEITVDLDVVARLDLLDFFTKECNERGATIVYATHIFDGLETWATDLAYIQDGELRRKQKLSELPELKTSPNLLSVVESWLRSEVKAGRKKNTPAAPKAQAQKPAALYTSPFMSSRHMAYYR